MSSHYSPYTLITISAQVFSLASCFLTQTHNTDNEILLQESDDSNSDTETVTLDEETNSPTETANTAEPPNTEDNT